MEVGIKVAIIDARDVDPEPFDSYACVSNTFPHNKSLEGQRAGRKEIDNMHRLLLWVVKDKNA